MFRQMGIPEDVYDGILTSGDATKDCLASHEFGTRCYHIGPERDLPLFEDTGVARVEEKDAEFILVTGPFDDEVEGPEDYRAQFGHLSGRGLPLVCANPDIVVERGDRHIYCAGALAKLYGELGGKTLYFGKPHGPVYGIARRRLGNSRTRRSPMPGSCRGRRSPHRHQGCERCGARCALHYRRHCGGRLRASTPETPEEDRVVHVLERAGVRATSLRCPASSGNAGAPAPSSPHT